MTHGAKIAAAGEMTVAALKLGRHETVIKGIIMGYQAIRTVKIGSNFRMIISEVPASRQLAQIIYTKAMNTLGTWFYVIYLEKIVLAFNFFILSNYIRQLADLARPQTGGLRVKDYQVNRALPSLTLFSIPDEERNITGSFFNYSA